jgi:epoxyqueuosine reductase
MGGAQVMAAASLSIEARLKAQALGSGFDLAGICNLGPAETANAFAEWVGAGYSGTMDYLARGAEKRRDSRRPLPGTRSAIVVAMNYGGREPGGAVARYARGNDYHDIMLERLHDLHRWIESDAGRPILGKAYVDTGPLLERDLARRAGLGWFGKNTNLINPSLGSFFFLGALLVDLDLTPDVPFDADRCGSCTRCLDACPTSAFVAPRVLDATRCISYLTIELKESIPLELREGVGDRVYGCDTCQDVCPWNERFAQSLPDGSPYASRAALTGRDSRTLAAELLAMGDEEFRNGFRGSPMKRAKLRGLKRNAAVALGNIGDERDIDILTRAQDDPDPLVRDHAAWALAQVERKR